MLLKIYGASTASLRKSECSTYNKYASASLLLNSLYLHRLFSKTLIQKHTVHLLPPAMFCTRTKLAFKWSHSLNFSVVFIYST